MKQELASMQGVRGTMTKRQQGLLRERVMRQAGKIVDLLAQNTMGTLEVAHQERDAETGELVTSSRPAELSASRLKSAEILLNKALPNLQSTELETVASGSGMTPKEVEERLFAMLTANPELQRRLAARMASETAETVPQPVIEETEESGVNSSEKPA